ncbi:sporulation YhaL family protein [Ralstonia pickettii]|nr:sporulation YhaL family protein [Ralstonia pickettii]
MIIGGVPLWVFVIIILIFFSGYMAFRAIQADRKLDQQYIEQEGQIYIDRMSEEKKEKAMRKRQEEA